MKVNILRNFKRVNVFIMKICPLQYGLIALMSLLQILSAVVMLKFSEFLINSSRRIITGETSGIDQEIRGILIFVVSILALHIIDTIRGILLVKVEGKMEVYQRENLLKKLSRISWDNFENHSENLKIDDAVDNSVESFKKVYGSSIEIFKGIIALTVYGFIMRHINPLAIAVYVAMLGVSFFVSGRMIKDINKIWEESRPLNMKEKYFFGLSGDKITHQEFRFNRMLKFTEKKWGDIFDDQYKLKMKLFKKFEISFQIMRFLVNSPYVFMLIFVSYEVVVGKHQVGFLILMKMMLNNIVNSIGSIQWGMAQSAEHVRSVENFFDILNKEEEYMEGEVEYLEPWDGLVIKNLSYMYPQGKGNIFNGLHLNIRKGEKIFLLGKNGSGKTTLTNILMGITKEYKGDLAVGEIRRKEEVVKYLRRNTGCILQDFGQYNMSIKENIAVGNPRYELDDLDIEKILSQVGLLEYVNGLKDGIHTQLGNINNGIELSKGQWQRIAIGRLLADKEKKIWILDEPTAFLDPISEIEIYDLIEELAVDRTVIFISHRLGFAKKAHRILLLDKGKLVESGTHEELMKLCGEYRKMYDVQKEWYLEKPYI